MKKSITKKFLLMSVILIGFGISAHAQGTTRGVYTANLNVTNTTQLKGHSVYNMTISCTDGAEAKYLNWLSEMNLNNSSLTQIEVFPATNTIKVHLDGLGGESRNSQVKIELDQYLQNRAVKEKLSSNPTPADLKLQSEHAEAIKRNQQSQR